MTQTIETLELALVIAASNYDPILLNPEFLTGSGIVPGDWQLARQPVVSHQASQIIYHNGINLIAQPNRLTLVESLASQKAEEVKIAEIARSYVAALPNLDYQAVSVNFRGYISCTGSPGGARDYLVKNLLTPGPWLESGTVPVQAGLNFLYTLGDKRFNLSLNEATLQLPEAEQRPIVLLSGQFDYPLTETPASDRLFRLQQIVADWESDRETYREIVSQFPEASGAIELVFPTLAQVS